MAVHKTRTLSADALKQYHRDGYHIARGLLDVEEAARLHAAFTQLAERGPVAGLSEQWDNADADDPLARYPRMMHPHRHRESPVGPLALRYLLDPRIGAVLSDLLDDQPIAAQTMFYFKPPGARGQDLHQDNFYLRVGPGTCMAAWIAVDDADRDNGGMVVVPGSHRLEVICPEQRPDARRFFSDVHVDPPPGMREQPADLRAGDVLFFNGSVIHGSYPNQSRDRFRRALICHYVPKACQAVAEHYHPLYDFTGRVVSRDVAAGGGPCGDAQPVAARG